MEVCEDPVPTNQHVMKYYGLTQDEYLEKYDIPKIQEKSLCEKLKELPSTCKKACGRDNVLRFVQDRVPGIRVIREYNVKEYLLGDIVSGLSVGIFTIPQGMGYAILAAVPPILGLYTCLFPALIYFVFGNCPHNAMGTMGVSSLIIATAVEKGTLDIVADIKSAGENNTELLELLEQEQISIAITMTFVGGVILILLTVFQLGFIVSYMGDAFVSGYLTGANIRVLTHQVILCLGLKDHVGSHTGFMNYFFLVADILKNIKSANVATVIVSVATLAIVLAVKYGINDRFASKLKVPVPVEAFVVVIGIVISYYADIHTKYGVKILKHVPQGMPAFTMPSPKHAKNYFVESCLLGVVCFVFSGMMAKLFCGRHGYTVNNNQELFATGLCNTIGGLFSCIGVSISPPRAFLMEMTGGHTQVAYLINAIFILLVLLVIAPLLAALPICILACLVITSCIPLFAHYIAFITYWKTSKYDFVIWLVTMACTLGINVDTGLVIGFIVSFIVIIFQSQHPYSSTLVAHDKDGVFIDAKKCETVKESGPIRVYKFDSPLYFATLDMFEENLYKSTVALAFLKKRRKLVAKANKKGKSTMSDVEKNKSDSVDTTLLGAGNPLDIRVIVIDCSCIAFADTPGARLLAKLRRCYEEYGIKFVLASCSQRVQELLLRVPECKTLEMGSFLYPSVPDAIIANSDSVDTEESV